MEKNNLNRKQAAALGDEQDQISRKLNREMDLFKGGFYFD